jgi:tetratricopeptide (TPR) repeat protein
MNPMSDMSFASSWLLLALSALPPNGAATQSTDSPRVADAPIAPCRAELLETAFRAASAMPLDPHVKNRSRAQEAVAAACLALDQPQRALAMIERIADWRRGAGYADYALACATRGDASEARRCLDLALRVSEADDGSISQDWRRSRIRAKVAKTQLALGREDLAASVSAGIDDSSAGELDVARADRIAPDEFDRAVEALDAAIATGSFDRVRGALAAYARLFDRNYADEARRALTAAKIRDTAAKLPATVRVEISISLADAAIAHGDREGALEAAGEIRAVLDAARLSATQRIPLLAKLAALRHRAGDVERPRKEADAAYALFAAERERIVDIDRAGTLRALAEAYAAMGDTRSALAVYARALEEGVGNPNSRPRAEDLAATCCSMAVHAVEPSAELWARIREIEAALGPPW